MIFLFSSVQGDDSPGKHGKVRELDSGPGKVRENGKSQGKLSSPSCSCTRERYYRIFKISKQAFQYVKS